MNLKETSAGNISVEKISPQETAKIKDMATVFKTENSEISAETADQKLMQRLDNQKDIEGNSPSINADAQINSGEMHGYGLMLCSDRCIKSRVNSGRCFHS